MTKHKNYEYPPYLGIPTYQRFSINFPHSVTYIHSLESCYTAYTIYKYKNICNWFNFYYTIHADFLQRKNCNYLCICLYWINNLQQWNTVTISQLLSLKKNKYFKLNWNLPFGLNNNPTLKTGIPDYLPTHDQNHQNTLISYLLPYG